MHYYQFNIADYRKDTTHLSILEHGVYRQLLDWHYLDEKPIPKETEVVIRRLSAKTKEEKEAVLMVLKEMFILTNEGYVQARVLSEIELYVAKSDRARINGKLGGRPKKTKEVISRNLEQTQEKANHKPLTNNHKPLTTLNTTQKNEFFADIDTQLVNDYLSVRKAKRAPKVSKTVYDGLVRESKIAGIDLSQALRVCVERNWVGFKADWYVNSKVNGKPNSEDQNKLNTERAYERLFGKRQNEKDITDEANRV